MPQQREREKLCKEKKNKVLKNRKRKQKLFKELSMITVIVVNDISSSYHLNDERESILTKQILLPGIKSSFSTQSFTSNNLVLHFFISLLLKDLKRGCEKVKRGFKACRLHPPLLSVKVNKVLTSLTLNSYCLPYSSSRIFTF